MPDIDNLNYRLPLDAQQIVGYLSCMKMIPSRQLAASPGKVWDILRRDGSVVITKDGRPRGIFLSTSEETLLEDVQDHIRIRAQRAASEIRREASKRGLDKMTIEEIDAEIAASRHKRHFRHAA